MIIHAENKIKWRITFVSRSKHNHWRIANVLFAAGAFEMLNMLSRDGQPDNGLCIASAMRIFREVRATQVTNDYGEGYLHRPDLALLVYGFVPLREPPIMSSCDLPQGFGEARQFPPSPLSGCRVYSFLFLDG